MKNSVFLDEIIDNYYKNIGDGYKNSYLPGQIVWTYFLYNYENLEFWRPSNYDETCTKAISFEICSSAKDLYNRQIPLIAPRLEIDEEFIVIRAKRRPAVLITPPPTKISVPTVRRGGKVNLKLCLLAPLFSLEDKHGNAKYRSEFVNRVRKLKYSHLFFLPEHDQRNIRNSICRFDRIFSNYDTHLDLIDLYLSGEALDIFISQIKCYLTGIIEGDYKVAHEILNI